MTKISVVINTLNEEKNLPKALASVKSFEDEIVVVDMKSDDKTQEIARSAGAKVYEHERTGYVEPARNFAISKAKGKWILILDADERVPKKLASKLKRIVSKSTADYYRIPRKNVIFGKWIKHSRWWPDYNIRFFKKGFVSWSEIIHSVPTTQGKGLDLEADEGNAIIHNHYTSVEQYLDRMNRYTTEHAKLKVKEGYKFEWPDLIKKPAGEFLSRYFQGEGYKDGVHGLALAGLQAFSEFVMYLKVWSHSANGTRDKQLEISDVIEVMKEVEDDFHYWQADSLLKFGGGLLQRIKRKFKLS
ncbi:glycosyltransferase family 2 protein [Patescibacteria group bacterium]|nr:glycosyltransferase family 2 protein [Patescibacteria group bacterium]